jgi:Co/Zn/Cd efflux system component
VTSEMDACCQSKATELETLKGEHSWVLKVVLAINAVLSVIELISGLLGRSTALLADSLDMLGDSLVYGFSLYVLSRSAEWKAAAAVLKGIIMAVFGVGVLIEAAYKMIAGVMPVAETMGIIGLLVLIGMEYVFFCSTATVPTISTCVRPGFALAMTSRLMQRCW